MSRKTTNDLLKGRLIKDKFIKDNLGNDKFQDILLIVNFLGDKLQITN